MDAKRSNSSSSSTSESSSSVSESFTLSTSRTYSTSNSSSSTLSTTPIPTFPGSELTFVKESPITTTLTVWFTVVLTSTLGFLSNTPLALLKPAVRLLHSISVGMSWCAKKMRSSKTLSSSTNGQTNESKGSGPPSPAVLTTTNSIPIPTPPGASLSIPSSPTSLSSPTVCKPRPIPNSYWATPLLLACEYPWTPHPKNPNRPPKLDSLLLSGVRTFIDLTECGELMPYVSTLDERCKVLNIPRSEVEYYRFAIRDRSLPSSLSLMQDVMSTLRMQQARNRISAVHCRGGIGRTGMVIGCWLVESGRVQDGREALGVIAREWKTVEKCKRYPCSPETGAQFEYVIRFCASGNEKGEHKVEGDVRVGPKGEVDVPLIMAPVKMDVRVVA